MPPHERPNSPNAAMATSSPPPAALPATSRTSSASAPTPTPSNNNNKAEHVVVTAPSLSSPGGGAPPVDPPPRLEPEVGGTVLTTFGLARVLQVRSRNVIKCQLEDRNSLSTTTTTITTANGALLVLQPDSYEVLSQHAPPVGSSALLADYALRLQCTAAREWKHRRAGRALELYQRVLIAASTLLVQPTSTSHSLEGPAPLPPSQRGDWVVRSIKCHTSAAQIALSLGRPGLALDFTKEALAVLDALERKKRPSTPTALDNGAKTSSSSKKANGGNDDDEDGHSTSSTGANSASSGDSNSTSSSSSDVPLQAVGQVKLFGECRLRALLLTAQALLELNSENQNSSNNAPSSRGSSSSSGAGTLARAALRVLEQAQKVLRRYAAPQYRARPEFRSTLKALVGIQKDLKRLKKQAKLAILQPKDDAAAAEAAKAAEASTGLGFASPLAWFRPRRVWFADDKSKSSSSSSSSTSPSFSSPPNAAKSATRSDAKDSVVIASRAVALATNASSHVTWTRRDTLVYGGVLAGGLMAFHYLLRQQRPR